MPATLANLQATAAALKRRTIDALEEVCWEFAPVFAGNHAGLAALEIDRSALVHTCWDLGSPVNTCVWFFQIVAGEIRVIDIDMDLDLTPVERVSRMLANCYLYGSHFLPHDAMATQKSGERF